MAINEDENNSWAVNIDHEVTAFGFGEKLIGLRISPD